MTEAKPKPKTRAKTAAKKTPTDSITFRCQWCQQERPLEEMTRLNRFSPVVIVCRGCARKIH